MRFDELNEDNYLLFAIKHYDNPQSTTQENFFNDMKKFKYVKRLMKRYKKTGDLQIHLIINHMIVLFNVFNDATIPLLFLKLEDELWPTLKSFLVFLNRVPDYPQTDLQKIPCDKYCLEQLNQLQ
ncbi:hypothetical protein [Synechococcus phage DSL-LC02]|nr:hypothetical protein [Synechococcus phage DSL-LC02]